MNEPEERAPLDAAGLARTAAFWVFGLFLTVGLAVQWATPLFGLWFCELFIFLGTPWVLLKSAGLSPWRATGASRFRPAFLGYGLAVGALNLFAAVLPIQAVAITLAPKALARAFDSSRLFEGRGTLEMVALIASVTLAAPFCEEFFFRGLLQNLWTRSGARGAAALIGSAILFSALHLDPVGFAARLELGLLFGFLYLRTGSLWPGVFAHAANNAVSTAVFFIGKRWGEQLNGEPDLRAALALGLVAGVPFLGLLRWGVRHGGLAATKKPAPDDDALARIPSEPWWKVARPWFAAAAASLAVFAAIKLGSTRWR